MQEARRRGGGGECRCRRLEPSQVGEKDKKKKKKVEKKIVLEQD